MIETKVCSVCGCEYKPKKRNQVTCGDEICKHIHHLEYLRRYNKAHRQDHREYNRAWMRAYRAEQKETVKEDKIIGLDYADRQKQKTLEIVGRIVL